MSINFLLLSAVCFSVIVWAFQSPRRLVSCPFQVAGTCVFFVLPQLFVLERVPSLAPEVGIDIFSYVAAGSVLANFLGYSSSGVSLASPVTVIDPDGLYRVGVIIGTAGIIGTLLLSAYITYVGVVGPWRGIPVYLYALSKFVFPGLVVMRVLATLYPERRCLFASLVFSLPAIAQAFINGRRSWVFLLLFSWLFPLLFTGRFKLNPLLASFGILGAFLVIVMLPAYRGELRRDGHSQILELLARKSPGEVLETYFSGDQTLEVRDAAVLIAVAHETQEFSWGAMLFNGVVQQFVPGAIIGRELKESMKLPVPNYLISEQDLRQDLGYRGGAVAGYTSKTGFFYVFAEFSWFCLVPFFFVGRLYRKLEDRCFEALDPAGVIALAFVGFMPSALVYSQWSFSIPIFMPNFFLLAVVLKFGVVDRLSRYGGKLGI